MKAPVNPYGRVAGGQIGSGQAQVFQPHDVTKFPKQEMAIKEGQQQERAKARQKRDAELPPIKDWSKPWEEDSLDWSDTIYSNEKKLQEVQGEVLRLNNEKEFLSDDEWHTRNNKVLAKVMEINNERSYYEAEIEKTIQAKTLFTQVATAYRGNEDKFALNSKGNILLYQNPLKEIQDNAAPNWLKDYYENEIDKDLPTQIQKNMLREKVYEHTDGLIHQKLNFSDYKNKQTTMLESNVELFGSEGKPQLDRESGVLFATNSRGERYDQDDMFNQIRSEWAGNNFVLNDFIIYNEQHFDEEEQAFAKERYDVDNMAEMSFDQMHEFLLETEVGKSWTASNFFPKGWTVHGAKWQQPRDDRDTTIIYNMGDPVTITTDKKGETKKQIREGKEYKLFGKTLTIGGIMQNSVTEDEGTALNAAPVSKKDVVGGGVKSVRLTSDAIYYNTKTGRRIKPEQTGNAVITTFGTTQTVYRLTQDYTAPDGTVIRAGEPLNENYISENGLVPGLHYSMIRESQYAAKSDKNDDMVAIYNVAEDTHLTRGRKREEAKLHAVAVKSQYSKVEINSKGNTLWDLIDDQIGDEFTIEELNDAIKLAEEINREAVINKNL